MVNPEQLLKLVDFNLANKNFENAVKLLDDEQYSKVILSHYPELIQDVLMKHMKSSDVEDSTLYNVCESIMKLLADKCHQEGIMFEFLEIIEGTEDDDIFTSVLKCLQVILLKQSEKKTRSLEYCLNSIEDYLQKLPLPDMVKVVDEEEEKILENDESLRRVLLMYMTLELFYEPIVIQLITNKSSDDTIFRSNKFNRENVLLTFILRLLGEPLAHLDLSYDEEKKIATYSRTIAEGLVKTIVKLDKNVLRYLEYGEKRIRWPIKSKINDDLDDIFLHDEKAPLLQFGMLFYLILVEKVEYDSIPKVYNPKYLFTSCIYLVKEMIQLDQSIIFKGLKLLETLLNNQTEILSADELGFDIHKDLCSLLPKIMIYSPTERNRKKAFQCIKPYILQFDAQGIYSLISNLLKVNKTQGTSELNQHLIIWYKDSIIQQIKQGEISEYMSGSKLKKLVLNEFCILEGGAACDISKSFDQILASLNFLRLMQIDEKNLTGIKDLAEELENGYLPELRKALDLSQAHFKEEQERVKKGEKPVETEMSNEIEILNGDNFMANFTKEKKLEMLNKAFLDFHLIEIHLGIVNGIINSLKTQTRKE